MVGQVGQVGQALIINRLQALLSRAAVGQTVGQKLTRFELSESSALNLPYLPYCCPTSALLNKKTAKSYLNLYNHNVKGIDYISALPALPIFEFLAS